MEIATLETNVKINKLIINFVCCVIKNKRNKSKIANNKLGKIRSNQNLTKQEK